MDHRERVLTALAHQEPDRVPLALWGSAYGVTDGLYHKLLRELGWQPVPPFRRRRGHTVNHYDDRILDLVDADIRYVWLGSTDLASPPAEGGIDAWGVPWRRAGGYLFASDPPLAQTGVEDMEGYPWPKVESLVREEGLRERARYLRDKTDYAVAARAVASYGPFEQACQLRGTEQFMMDLLTNEDFAAALLDRIVDVLCRWLEIYLDIISPYVDIMELPGDDYASQTAPLISPRLFDKYFKPRWQRLINLVKQASSRIYVLFHSDGAVAPFIPSLLEAGVDILHPLEPVPATEMATVKREYGHQLSFLGGIDIKQAMTRSEEEVVAEVRRRIGLLAEGGGYILAPSNHLQPDIPQANVVALFQAARKYGRYPLVKSQ
jgi:uroporphyrinogen decarboxylase